MTIRLAEKEELKEILEVIKERCDWFQKNNINQWRNNYPGRYNEDYFYEAMQVHKLYIAVEDNKIIGVFLLKESDKVFWDNDDPAYYIHHLATKIGYPGVGSKILKFIEELAKKDSKKYIRLDCKKSNVALNQYYQNQGFTFKGDGEEPYSHNLWEKEVK